MFRQFTYRLIPLVLGLIPGPPPRGRTTITEAAETDIDANLTADVDRPDRGDVPGWVLITLMTAGLVVALWALAGEAFTSMFQDAMNKVRGAG
ncbi:hypothetical protein [Brevibacterium permense]|uniref:hypothetical protein n=1 Tax=Brevibacterium permense TaxID=234834 RepID=UPI0023EE5803|nr:hypothetical protein [Brevibacterium permense]